jgi:hypothetical protein
VIAQLRAQRLVRTVPGRIEIVQTCADWLSEYPLPKLFIDADPAGS